MAPAPHFTKAFQWDLGRQVERLDFLLRWLPRYAAWGYEELYLHLEDAVEFPGLPGVARRDAYSHGQFAHLVAAATAEGIRVVPIVNLLGHTQYLIKVPALRDLNELRDASGAPLDQGQICPLHPRTLAVAASLLDDMAPFCTAGKVHVGLDESFHLGRCPRCRADVRRRGLAAHFAAHVQHLHRLAADRGLRLGMWADMLALLPAAIPALPRGVIAYDWYYYQFARHPRVELRNFAEVDLAAPLRAHGIEYWGCPMNGAFRHEPLPVFGDRLANIASWWRRCRRTGAAGLLVTSWEANRLAVEMATAVDAAAASLWLDPGIEDPREMLARGFARVFGRSAGLRPAFSKSRRDAGATPDARRWARLALASDAYAFAGYPRWQINDRWDVCAGAAGAAPYERELRALQRSSAGLWPALPESRRDAGATSDGERRLRAGSYKEGCPPALAASLAFRLYLARRDVFVRRAAEGVFALRRMHSAGVPPASGACRPEAGATLARLRAEVVNFAAALRGGRAAARAMWRLSRNPRVRGPNERILAADAARLAAWRRWLARAARDPAIAWRATPVCGAWQLQFTVHHFAPAMQKIVVEQRQPDGAWRTLHSCHLIEFRGYAAAPRTKIRKEFSVPVEYPGPRRPTPVPGDERSAPATLLPPGAGAGLSARPGRPLRIAVRGIGQVAVSAVALTDGVRELAPRGRAGKAMRILGVRARRRGFPDFDFERNLGELSLADWDPAPRRA